jgi:hypothetical protein
MNLSQLITEVLKFIMRGNVALKTADIGVLTSVPEWTAMIGQLATTSSITTNFGIGLDGRFLTRGCCNNTNGSTYCEKLGVENFNARIATLSRCNPRSCTEMNAVNNPAMECCRETCLQENNPHHESQCKSKVDQESWVPTFFEEKRDVTYNRWSSPDSIHKARYGNVPVHDFFNLKNNEGMHYAKSFNLLFPCRFWPFPDFIPKLMLGPWHREIC